MKNFEGGALGRSMAMFCALAGLGTGCVFNDNGSTFTGSNIGRVVNFSGLARNPGEQIKVQVLSNGSWVTLGTATASNSPFDLNGTPSYNWSINVVPVPGAGQDNRWKSGGLARFRTLSGTNQPLVTFDDTDCWLDAFNNGDSPAQIQLACQSHASPVLTFVDKDPTPNYNGYLTFRQNELSQADDYNNEIDAPPTLDSWKNSRGFPNGEVVAKYYNKGDLGIGREMHCRQQANAAAQNMPDVACYVTNYGSVLDGLADSNSALADAISGHNPFATVAMDYWSTETNKVRFYTYGDAGQLVEEAALDTQGNKPTPGLCLNCHGGVYDADQNDVVGANFLPFDLEAFGFVQPVVGGFQAPGPVYTKEGQQEEFRLLNQMVRNTQPATAIRNLIDGWYGGLGGLQTPNTIQNANYVPPGWADEATTYKQAIAPYCRTCHVALVRSGKPNLDFDTVDKLANSASEAFVCSHSMPHAEVTRKAFWASPARAHLSGTFGWTGPCN